MCIDTTCTLLQPSSHKPLLRSQTQFQAVVKFSVYSEQLFKLDFNARIPGYCTVENAQSFNPASHSCQVSGFISDVLSSLVTMAQVQSIISTAVAPFVGNDRPNKYRQHCLAQLPLLHLGPRCSVQTPLESLSARFLSFSLGLDGRSFSGPFSDFLSLRDSWSIPAGPAIWLFISTFFPSFLLSYHFFGFIEPK